MNILTLTPIFQRIQRGRMGAITVSKFTAFMAFYGNKKVVKNR